MKVRVYVIVNKENRVIFDPYDKLKDAKERIAYEKKRQFGEKDWRVKSFVIDDSMFTPALGKWVIEGRKLKYYEQCWQGD